MSLIDDVFGSIPRPIIDSWGTEITYIKAPELQAYDPTTGTVSGTGTEIPARALIMQIEGEEKEGFYQKGMVKFIIPASYLGDYYPAISDSISYEQAGVTLTAKIVKPTPYRGDFPIMHSVIARLG